MKKIIEAIKEYFRIANRIQEFRYRAFDVDGHKHQEDHMFYTNLHYMTKWQPMTDEEMEWLNTPKKQLHLLLEIIYTNTVVNSK